MKTLIGWLVWCVLRLYVWIKLKPTFVFSDPKTGAPYLQRWPIWTRDPWPDAQGRTGGEGWYLHKFLSSDHDRNLHNHPSAYAVAFVLRSGYREQRRQTDDSDSQYRLTTFRPGDMNVITSATFHRVTLHGDERPSWSLFYIGPRSSKGWGFLQPSGAVKRAPHHDGHTGAVTERRT